MSDTPRTDAAIQRSCIDDLKCEWVEVEFARKLERENAALRLALDQQANYQRELRADRDRLDDLQRNKWQVHWTGHNWYVSSPKGKYFPDIRQAIDAAREEQP
jgi:hypothetical protein